MSSLDDLALGLDNLSDDDSSSEEIEEMILKEQGYCQGCLTWGYVILGACYGKAAGWWYRPKRD